MNELPTIAERVEKGICWLEGQGAYDWAEKIVAAVDEAAFDMSDCFRCAVGVTLGSYIRDFLAPVEASGSLDANEEGKRLGLFADHDSTYCRLEREWERKAREHAAYRAEILG